MEVDEEQRCTSCGTTRQKVCREPIARGYDLQHLHCPNCKTIVRMVGRRSQAKKNPAQEERQGGVKV